MTVKGLIGRLGKLMINGMESIWDFSSRQIL